MKRIGFDSEKYIRLQSERIRERIEQFGGKLYLEFGGKLIDKITTYDEYLESDEMARKRQVYTSDTREEDN